MAKQRGRRAGFTLIELMIAVAIIGIIASVAIPNYRRFQFKAKSGEGKLNLAALRTAEEAYFTEYGVYLAATPNPVLIPGTSRDAFDVANVGFNEIGWKPEGMVFFSYGVSITTNAKGYSADAGADLDGNEANQYWAYVKEGGPGMTGLPERANGAVGCITAPLLVEQVLPCTPQSGQSVF